MTGRCDDCGADFDAGPAPSFDFMLVTCNACTRKRAERVAELLGGPGSKVAGGFQIDTGKTYRIAKVDK